jgi:signal transduction histidine kinase
MLHSRKQAQIRLRRQINSDLHDDIGSKIAAISLASRDVELHASEERVRKRGRWIGSVVETMHQGLRDVLWLTNDQTDTLVLLVQKLAETARQSVPESQLKLHVSDTSTLPNRSIQLQMKRDILFFAREALNNATTHSEATLISVHIQVEKSTLLLRIEDNGRGFDVPPLDDQRDRAIGHFGLQTMRDRVERLDGTVQMRSTPDEGTRIELTVKL